MKNKNITFQINNKTIVDIRLRPRCAIPSPLLCRLAASPSPRNFLNTICACLAYWMISSAARRYWRLNDPFCSKRGSDGYSEDYQCFWMTRTTPENCPFPWGFCLYLIHGSFFRQIRVFIHLDRFSRFCTAHRKVPHYFAVSRWVPPKIAPSPWGIDSPMCSPI